MLYHFLINIYFIIPLILIIFLLDFWLTIKGQQYYRKIGIKYVKMGSYEMNPIWVKSVRKEQYDHRHFLGVMLILLGILFVHFADESKMIYEYIIGFLIIGWFFIISGHIQNIIYFWYIGNHPESIKGLIIKKPDLSYVQSILGTFSLFIILFLIFIYSPSIFLFGGVNFSLLLILVQFIWYKRTIRKRGKKV